MNKFIWIILIISHLLQAKVIYESFPIKGKLKLDSQKNKTIEELKIHKVNYLKFMEKLGFDYIIGWKSGVNSDGDTINFFDDRLYEDKINLKKFKELQEFGLNYADYNEMGFLNPVDRQEISVYTLIHRILSTNFIFIGTVKDISPSDIADRFSTKAIVNVDEMIKGEYYFNEIPESFDVYYEYGPEPGTGFIISAKETEETEPILGEKYIFFADKSITTQEKYQHLNRMNLLISRQMLTISLMKNEIDDNKWYYEAYRDIKILKSYIKLVEKINDTENFYDIDFR